MRVDFPMAPVRLMRGQISRALAIALAGFALSCATPDAIAQSQIQGSSFGAPVRVKVEEVTGKRTSSARRSRKTETEEERKTRHLAEKAALENARKNKVCVKQAEDKQLRIRAARAFLIKCAEDAQSDAGRASPDSPASLETAKPRGSPDKPEKK